MILCGCNPGCSAVRAEDHPQPAITRSIRSVKANERTVTQNIKTRCEHPKSERLWRRPRVAMIAGPADLAFRPSHHHEPFVRKLSYCNFPQVMSRFDRRQKRP